MAYTIEDLKNKLIEMYPEIKNNSITVTIYFSAEKNAYVIKFQKENQELITYLDRQDADDCMNNVKCVYLGVQVGQFIGNFEDRSKFEKVKLPESITVVKYKEIRIGVDKDGYLINFDDWNEEVAQVLAEREGFGKLTNQQLDILKFIRDYYKNYNFFPVLNAVCKNVKQPNECMAEYFMDPLVAWKLAGLPKPDETLINIVKYGVTPT
ncbi:MAG TPA: TusE/DsrC/DsvC family sulfur relay protein [Thermodesulfovibrio thiophilus]|nr:TusE/DsrC/DsvC family sulfur relay protein [Thermodesulfovibrio thiophilus]